MNALKKEFSSGFEVLGFPCNQFAMHEPGVTGAEILNTIKYVRPGNNFVPNFKMFQKSEVNGKSEIPLYTYLKGQCNPVSDEFRPKERLFYEGMRVSDVRWNFEVFLINKRGYPAYRFSVGTSMQDFATAIRELLDEPIV